jgi:hypothetical protein
MMTTLKVDFICGEEKLTHLSEDIKEEIFDKLSQNLDDDER